MPILERLYVVQLTDIHFPVYRLLLKRPETENGRSTYSNTYMHIDTANEYTHVKLIDDLNAPGDLLSKRRLYLEGKGEHLYPLNTAIFFLHDFLKLAGGGRWFIDSSGKIFNYKKTKSVPLVFYKVTNIIPSKTMGSIIEVSELPSRYKTMINLNSPTGLYAGFLLAPGAPIFYGVFNQKYRNTRRMI